MFLEGEVDESDCCGNGCANCILDTKCSRPSRASVKAGKKNIIQGYAKFRLVNRQQTAGNVLDLHFSCCVSNASDYVLDIPPGHHVMMRAPIQDEAAVEGDTKLLLRPYSPYWSDVVGLEFKILVHLLPEGQMSKYISTLAVNDEVEFRGPVGSYDIHESKSNYLFIISQGVAIAPTLPIADAVLRNDDDERRILHLACFCDLESVYFRERLQEYNKYWNFKGRIYLAHQQCATCAAGCEEHCGNLLKSLRYKEDVKPVRLDALQLREICGTAQCPAKDREFIICGTREFQNSMVKVIESAAGATDEKINLL